jgi:D-glutamate cyclase
MNEALLNMIGERVDTIVTLDTRSRGEKCPIMEVLHPASRKKCGGPVSLTAANRLLDNVGEGDTVFFITGMACYGLAMETDGPPGVVALGRALQVGLKARPIFITHPAFIEIMTATATSAGFMVVPEKDIEEGWKRMPSATLVEGFPIDQKEATEKVASLFKKYGPKAVIAVEARGPNTQGEYHVIDGSNVTARESKMAMLFDEAKKKDVFTLGALDGCGHEIGFGTVYDSVADKYPRYTKCDCGCESGMHNATEVDIAIPAAISNWGAYGVEACLSAILNSEDVLHDAETESRIIRACADAGAMDGLTGRSEYSVDGVSEVVQMSIVSILQEIVRNARNEYKPGFD